MGEDKSSLEVTEQEFQEVSVGSEVYCTMCLSSTRDEVVDVNLKGVLFTAQAAGRQMARFDHGGSIIMVASICGSVAVDVRRI